MGDERSEAFAVLNVLLPLDAWRKLDALARVEGVSIKEMAVLLLTEAGDDYYGKPLPQDD